MKQQEVAKMEEKRDESGREAIEEVPGRFWDESKKMWSIAAPAMLTAVAQFSISFVTAAFVGHLGDVELAAVSVVQNVIEGFVYGVMALLYSVKVTLDGRIKAIQEELQQFLNPNEVLLLESNEQQRLLRRSLANLLGMGSALETLCGQAVGAGQFNMLGIYLQRSWIITSITSLILLPFYIFTSPFLNLLRQDKEISHLAGKYCRWAIPQLFAYALNFPIQKFLQSQSKVWFMTIVSTLTLGVHLLLNWIFLTKLGYGLLGAAMAGNISWWLLIMAQIAYVVSGYFPDAWTGFSMLAFKSLTSFLRLSISSAIMLCLEIWYYTAVILMVGGLKNPAIAVDAVSICMNMQLWALMITLGFNAAVSVRVSNELGAGNPKAAKFSVFGAVLTSSVVGIVFTAVIVATKKGFPKLFTEKPVVISETSKLGYFLSATIFLNSIQPVLCGVAVGAGWQFQVAVINIGCYYVVGLPIGAVLGYALNLSTQGIWTGILIGSLIQTVVLLMITAQTKWSQEALQADARVKAWGGGDGNIELQQNTTNTIT